MPDLSITAANVVWSSGTRPRTVKGGATIARGKVLYKDSADSDKYKLADANTAALATPVAIALTDGTNGSDMLVAEAGATINVGATTTAGVAYVLTSTDAGTAIGSVGGIVLATALGAGDTPTLLFYGSGTAVVTLVFAKAPVAI